MKKGLAMAVAMTRIAGVICCLLAGEACSTSNRSSFPDCFKLEKVRNGKVAPMGTIRKPRIIKGAEVEWDEEKDGPYKPIRGKISVLLVVNEDGKVECESLEFSSIHNKKYLTKILAALRLIEFEPPVDDEGRPVSTFEILSLSFGPENDLK